MKKTKKKNKLQNVIRIRYLALFPVDVKKKNLQITTEIS